MQIPVATLTIQRRYCCQKPADKSTLLFLSCEDGVLLVQLRIRIEQIDILLSQQGQMLLPLLCLR